MVLVAVDAAPPSACVPRSDAFRLGFRLVADAWFAYAITNELTAVAFSEGKSPLPKTRSPVALITELALR